MLRATTACNFSSLISPDVSAPSALASLLFNPPEPQKPRKNTVFSDFPTFSRTCIFFLLIFSLLTLLPADCFFISPYCREFDFQTSFAYPPTVPRCLGSLAGIISEKNIFVWWFLVCVCVFGGFRSLVAWISISLNHV